MFFFLFLFHWAELDGRKRMRRWWVGKKKVEGFFFSVVLHMLCHLGRGAALLLADVLAHSLYSWCLCTHLALCLDIQTWHSMMLCCLSHARMIWTWKKNKISSDWTNLRYNTDNSRLCLYLPPIIVPINAWFEAIYQMLRICPSGIGVCHMSICIACDGMVIF